ncbi:LOW QUALITY PROTEIN: piggyBac transposable element-derived protein 4-like [Vespula squamosa]|uniref:PiggyBac transposable element-derived protein 4-like n=1 Tax=Vespula squamosa TaxID=30214 RepID=A0ABD2BG76_VESSQ
MNLTVNEQLFPTKVRCKLTQYIPNKPDKFRIKFWLASDTNNTRPSSIPIGDFVVLQLIKRWEYFTTNNFFTSASLATKLSEKRTTLFGVTEENCPTWPKDKIKRFSKLLYKSNNFTLIIYKSKPSKKVTILNSKNKSVKINNDRKQPEIVAYYNKSKFGGDVTDQMARKYSVKSKSYRWVVQVSLNILDLASINA